MKNKFHPLIPLLHLIVLGGLILVVAIEVHWSAATLFTWVCYTVSSFSSATGRLKIEFEEKMKKQRKDFTDIVTKAAENIKVTIPQRPKGRFLGEHVPPPAPNPEKPHCVKCTANPQPGAIIHNQGNCPIHD